MFIFLGILLTIITYIVMAGVTRGYAKHRWPPIVEYSYYHDRNLDKNEDKRDFATWLWPFYWMFIYPFTKVNEVTFSHIEKEAALQVAKNKSRIADLHATRAAVEASNAELEAAEVELEKEIDKL
jgi:hypothetical protein